MNRLDHAAKRLGIKASFDKRHNPISDNMEWCMTAKDGVQCERWMGQNMNDAVVWLEAEYDRLAYK